MHEQFIFLSRKAPLNGVSRRIAGQVFIQAVDFFVSVDIPEVFILRKDIFAVFDGEKLSFVHNIKYENLSCPLTEVL
jgi:hypothetical protein